MPNRFDAPMLPVLQQPGDLVDEREAAAILDCAIATLRNWRSARPRKGPRFRKIGKRMVRYSRADFAAFIAGDDEASA